MTLHEGTLLGRYRIRAPLGAGGMGEVYLAEDAQLDRRVALKLLSAALTANAERVRRFEQEARAASALNHPNILTIYELGEANQIHYIAAEYVDGDTLRKRLRAARLNISESLDIAIQVAAALAVAHEAGIVHRDIKPENIMIRRADGIVKVVDFGLAKLLDTPPLVEVDLDASTQFNVFTTPGALLGTTPYMSPEQARGLEIDARSDIFSFGSVLYEMMTGVMPFKGMTKTDMIIAVIQEEPLPLARYAPDAPEELQRIISKALRKERDERYQTAKDLLLDLKSLKEELHWQRLAQSKGQTTSGKSPAVSTHDANGAASAENAPVGTSVAGQLKTRSPARIASSKTLFALLAALILVGAAAFFASRWRQRDDADGVSKLPLATAQVASWKSALNEPIGERGRFSPDGKFVAYASTKDGNLDIWIKQLAGGEPAIVPGTRDEWRDYSPIWSPDEQQIAFLSDRSNQFGIWTVPFLGGTPVFIKDVPRGRNLSLIRWMKNGAVFYQSDDNLFALDLKSKEITQLTRFDSTQRVNRYFAISPDEETIAYDDSKDGKYDIWMMPLRGASAPLRVTNDGANNQNPIWLPDGRRILYNSTRNGVAQIYVAYADGRPPAQITASDSDNYLCDVSFDGSKILYANTRDEADLWGAQLGSAKEFQITSDVGIELWADASPDGERLVYQAKPVQHADAQVFDCALYIKALTDDEQRLRLSENGFYPQWSPDGNRIAYLARKTNPNEAGKVHWEIYIDDGGAARKLFESDSILGLLGWDGAGRNLLVKSAEGKRDVSSALSPTDLLCLKISIADGKAQTFAQLRAAYFTDMQAAPDGGSIAFVSRENKMDELRLMSSSGGESRKIISAGDPRVYLFGLSWSRDGKTIYYGKQASWHTLFTLNNFK